MPVAPGDVLDAWCVEVGYAAGCVLAFTECAGAGWQGTRGDEDTGWLYSESGGG